MRFENKKVYKYNLKESDAILSLKGFPLEVIEKMIDRQVETGYDPNVRNFQKDPYCFIGGFDWSMSVEGGDFWNNVIHRKKFEIFFEKYPKK